MVQSQTRQARLHQRPWGEPRAVDQHVEFSAAAGVAAHSVVLVEVYLARIHHFPERREETHLKMLEKTQKYNMFLSVLQPQRGLRVWIWFVKRFLLPRGFLLQADLTSGGIKTGRGRYCLLSRCIDSLQQQEQVQTRQKAERYHSAARSRVIWSSSDNNAASLWNVLAKPTADRLSTSAN